MDNLIEFCKQQKIFPSSLLYDLLSSGQLEHVKSLLNIFSYPNIDYDDIIDYDKVIINSHKSENYELIDYVINIFGIKPIEFDTIEILFSNESKYLVNFFNISYYNYDKFKIIHLVCKYAKIDFLDILMKKIENNGEYLELFQFENGLYTSNDFDFVKYLHETYTEKYIRLSFSYIIFYYACQSSNIDIINYLYEKYNFNEIVSNLDIYHNPLENYARMSNIKCIDHIIQLIPNINFKLINNCLLICMTDKYKYQELFEYLMNKFGDNFNFYHYYTISDDDEKQSALTIACRYGQIEYVKYILDNYPHEKDYNFYYEITFKACISGNIELIDYLYNKFTEISELFKKYEFLKHIIFAKTNLDTMKFIMSKFSENDLRFHINYFKRVNIANNKIVDWIRDGCKMPERKIKCADF